jgi:lipopolysaccharide export system permease protein
MIAAFIISSALWVGSNFLIPKASKIKNEFSSKYIKSTTKAYSSDIHCFVNPNEKIYLRYFKAKDTSGQTFRLETFKDDKLKKYVKATRIKLKEEPNLWTLSNYEIRTFDGMRDSLLIAKGEKIDTVIDITAGDFIRSTKLMENMTSGDLREFIQRERERGLGSANAHAIELSRRTADPFTILILTIIGVSIASRKTRGGIGLHLALGVILGASYVILSRFSVTFSTNLSLSPAVGVWIPNLIYGAIALLLFYKAQK